MARGDPLGARAHVARRRGRLAAAPEAAARAAAAAAADAADAAGATTAGVASPLGRTFIKTGPGTDVPGAGSGVNSRGVLKSLPKMHGTY